jgi:DNA-binding transcriptional ArsR family regulator
VDVVLSLRKCEGNSKKTHRILQTLSRFSETPPELLLDFSDNWYNSLGPPHDAAVKEAKDSIIAIAPKSETEALDLRELTENTKVTRPTAQRAVKELADEGKLCKVGKGQRGNPFRYYLTENRFCPASDIGGQKETAEDADLQTPS